MPSNSEAARAGRRDARLRTGQRIKNILAAECFRSPMFDKKERVERPPRIVLPPAPPEDDNPESFTLTAAEIARRNAATALIPTGRKMEGDVWKNIHVLGKAVDAVEFVNSEQHHQRLRLLNSIRLSNNVDAKPPEVTFEKGFELKPWQHKGIRLLDEIAREFGGAFLFDAVGLGKTMTALMTAITLRNRVRPLRGYILVVCPKACTDQWMLEISRFAKFSGLRYTHVTDPNAHPSWLLKHDIVVCTEGYLRARANTWTKFVNFGMLKAVLNVSTSYLATQIEPPKCRPTAPLHSYIYTERDQHISVVIIDESHHYSNPNSQLTNAVQSLTYKYVLALSGTPFFNTWEGMIGQLRLLGKNELVKSVEHFRMLFTGQDKFQDAPSEHGDKLFHKLFAALVVSRPPGIVELPGLYEEFREFRIVGGRYTKICCALLVRKALACLRAKTANQDSSLAKNQDNISVKNQDNSLAESQSNISAAAHAWFMRARLVSCCPLILCAFKKTEKSHREALQKIGDIIERKYSLKLDTESTSDEEFDNFLAEKLFTVKPKPSSTTRLPIDTNTPRPDLTNSGSTTRTESILSHDVPFSARIQEQVSIPDSNAPTNIASVPEGESDKLATPSIDETEYDISASISFAKDAQKETADFVEMEGHIGLTRNAMDGEPPDDPDDLNMNFVLNTLLDVVPRAILMAANSTRLNVNAAENEDAQTRGFFEEDDNECDKLMDFIDRSFFDECFEFDDGIEQVDVVKDGSIRQEGDAILFPQHSTLPSESDWSDWEITLSCAEDHQIYAPRIEAIIRVLEEIHRLYPSEKTIICSESVLVLDVVREAIRRRNGMEDTAVFEYSGRSQSSASAATGIEGFRACHRPTGAVLLLSARAGGTGINLHYASQVIICDPFWAPGLLAQVIGRAHRMPQHLAVRVYKVVSPDLAIDRHMTRRMAVKKHTTSGLFNRFAEDDVKDNLGELQQLVPDWDKGSDNSGPN